MMDSAHAFYRSRTPECKDQIENSACYFKVLKSLDYTHRYKRLNTQCKTIQNTRTYQPVGCLESLDGLKSLEHVVHQDIAFYNHEVCIDYCITYYTHFYAVYSNESKCICVKNLTLKTNFTSSCKLPIYRTGRLERIKRNESFIPNKNQSEIIETFNKRKLEDKNNLPRIVFLFTVYQKTDRQILRLLKTIYDSHHYYFIHVDEVFSNI